MSSNHLRGATRRTLLALWLPSTLLLLVVGGVFISQPNALDTLDRFSAGNDDRLFAAAPPRGAVLGDSIVIDHDARAHMLETYLRQRGSPMASHAGTFIAVADKYDLDWRLLPAIAGAESTFGKFTPKQSHNAWGWGIPTGAQKGIGFSSWDQGIETVGLGLRTKYFDQGYTSLRKIESRYTPPSAANPNHPWVAAVEQFMYEIENTR